ncbi:MAG: acyltransferase [Lachnospiraceae bacterium]|nr:acyltransferase [Lachnospiraceae bacterium]
MLKLNCFLPRISLWLQKIRHGKKLRMIGWPFIYRFPNASIEIGDNVIIRSNFWSNLLGLHQRTIIIAKNNAKIKIGNNVGISGATIYAWDTIEIGDYSIIGANVKIVDNDFHPIFPEDRIEGNYDRVVKKPVKIGKNVFIGMGSYILKGTQIGDNTVIGAGSVVSGIIPSNVVVAGNPAKVIREIEKGQ